MFASIDDWIRLKWVQEVTAIARGGKILPKNSILLALFIIKNTHYKQHSYTKS